MPQRRRAVIWRLCFRRPKIVLGYYGRAERAAARRSTLGLARSAFEMRCILSAMRTIPYPGRRPRGLRRSAFETRWVTTPTQSVPPPGARRPCDALGRVAFPPFESHAFAAGSAGTGLQPSRVRHSKCSAFRRRYAPTMPHPISCVARKRISGWLFSARSSAQRELAKNTGLPCRSSPIVDLFLSRNRFRSLGSSLSTQRAVS